jgi:hypothetical protein
MEFPRMTPLDRRDFHKKLLGSLMAYGFIEGAFASNLFADAVKPVIQKWLTELAEMTNDLRGRKLTDLEFQEKMEDLYRRADLPELLRLVELDRLAATTKLPDNGAGNVGIDLSKVDGLPGKLAFGRQVFALKQGRSIVPHGHHNMCTGFIILRGEFHGKHYDKMETHKEHFLIKPTLDRAFKPGELSTISDHKDNVHWFKCKSETGYIFNVHVVGYDNKLSGSSGRLYMDVEGEKTAGGLILAKRMTSDECHKKYG